MVRKQRKINSRLVQLIIILTLMTFSITLLCSCSSKTKTRINDTANSAQKDDNIPRDDKSEKITGDVRVSLVGWPVEDGIDPFSGRETKGVKTILEETFNKEYPNIKIDLNVIPWDNAKAKQQTLLMSKSIDVLYTSSAYIPGFDEQNLIEYIDDLIEKDKSFDPGIYPEGIWNGHTATVSLYTGKRLGLPFTIGQRMIVYDKKIFDDWGVEYLSYHPTPDEILEKAKKMTGINPKTGEQTYGLWLSGTDLGATVFRAASYYFDAPIAEGKFTDYSELVWKLNSPNMVKTFKWLAEIAPLCPPAFATGGGAENFGRENNNIAINLQGNGALVLGDYKASGKKDMIERFIPVLHLGPNGECHVPCDPIIMAKGLKNKDASWKVMKFLASYELQKWYYEDHGGAPALGNPDFIDPLDKYMPVALEIAANATLTHVNFNPFFISDMAPFINNYLVDAVTEKTWDIQDRLDKLQEKAKEWSAIYK